VLRQVHRFHGHHSLKGVYDRGRSIRGGLLNLKVATRDPKRPYRVAVVVSKKVHKSAVTRNRIRRRVYELVRTSTHQPQPGTDLVFTVYSEQVAELPAAKLQATVDDLLQKASHGIVK